MDASPPVSVPRLTTRRLRLREYRLDDFDAFAAHVADAEAMTFLGCCDRQTAWRLFGSQAGSWLLQGAGWWTVERHDTGQRVGTVGAFFREGLPGLEVGWNTYRPFWGQGFASEAAAEVSRYLLEVRGERRWSALIAAGNTASLRVAQHLGLRRDGEVDLHGSLLERHTLEREP